MPAAVWPYQLSKWGGQPSVLRSGRFLWQEFVGRCGIGFRSPRMFFWNCGDLQVDVYCRRQWDGLTAASSLKTLEFVEGLEVGSLALVLVARELHQRIAFLNGGL